MTGPKDASTRHPSAKAFGHPLHRLVDSEPSVNGNGVRFVRLTAACGHTDTVTALGFGGPKDFRSARTGEFCEKGCWT